MAVLERYGMGAEVKKGMVIQIFLENIFLEFTRPILSSLHNNRYEAATVRSFV